MIRGGIEKSPYVIIEKFVPRDHKYLSAQVAEYFWTNKAMKLLYHVGESDEELALVHQTS